MLQSWDPSQVDTDSCFVSSFVSPPVLYEMSKLLQTGLTRDQLSLCITLCETGAVNPEALAMAIKELKREAQAMQQR